MKISLFVYGTLKRGQSAHRRLCPRERSVRRARVEGRLFVHRAGYPALVVPRTNILAVATGDDAADVTLEQEARKGVRRLSRVVAVTALFESGGPWGWVGGELIEFEAPSFASFDAYEDFTPGRPSLFVRVLVRVWPTTGLPTLAWTYVAGRGVPAAALTPVAGGCWPSTRS